MSFAGGVTGPIGPIGVTGPIGPQSILSYALGVTTRALNSVFTPHATFAVLACYTFEISCTASLSGGQSGSVLFKTDNTVTPSAVVAQVYNSNSVALAIALTAVNTQRAPISYLVPPGQNVLLTSAGNASISMINQSEVILNQS